LSALEGRRKKNQIETQELQNCRNTQSKSIGKAKAAGEDIKPLLKFNSFSGKDACKLLADGAQLVDVRSSSEFSQGALPNAINLPLQSIMNKSSRWFLVMRQQMNAIAPPISSMVLTWVLCHLLFTRIQTVYRISLWL
jgi:3-mercaptopyruvate sulfurtransferase SseA